MKRNHTAIYWFPLAGAVLLAIGLWIGYLLSPRIVLSDSERKLLDIFHLVQDEYVDEVDIDSLVELSIPGILQNLDPHSAYISAKDLERVNSELEGSFGGIGIKFQMATDTVTVMEVIAGSPSDAAGLRAGDRIVKVDGEDIAGRKLSDQDVFGKLRGKAGTKVQLTVRRRGNADDLTFDLTRADIPQPSIEAAYMTPDSIGYIKVGRFARDTYQEFYQKLVAQAFAGAKGFIIDLRGNTGGYMEPAVFMANEFLPAGSSIVKTLGRKPEENSEIKADGTGLFQNYDVTVLIDEISASASEIFSGAMQDNDRALIVGRRSFGKGLVQKPVMLEDGSEIRLTVQRYYTPSGRCIQKDYSGTDLLTYESEIYERYLNGEVFGSEPETERDPALMFKTIGGRTVYGGGGITPDEFVPADTSRRTQYYLDAVRQGLIQSYAIEYIDLNRKDLSKYKTLPELLRNIDRDETLLWSFTNYAASKGLKTRWYYIRESAPLIINLIKAQIANGLLGQDAFFEIINQEDADVKHALQMINQGAAAAPIGAPKESIR